MVEVALGRETKRLQVKVLFLALVFPAVQGCQLQYFLQADLFYLARRKDRRTLWFNIKGNRRTRALLLCQDTVNLAVRALPIALRRTPGQVK